MVVATVVMINLRDRIDQVHVVLVYLLLILGASVSGGRLLAIPLACAGFLLIDYYFQKPYADFTTAKPLDWVALDLLFADGHRGDAPAGARQDGSQRGGAAGGGDRVPGADWL